MRAISIIVGMMLFCAFLLAGTEAAGAPGGSLKGIFALVFAIALMNVQVVILLMRYLESKGVDVS